MKNNAKELFLCLKVFHKNIHFDKFPTEKMSIARAIATNFWTITPDHRQEVEKQLQCPGQHSP